jgi:osmoprotectant transport system permease protein
MKRSVLLAAALLFTAAAWPAGEPGPLRIGSKRFTESYILAHVLAQTAQPHLAAPPEVKQGLGNTAITFEALKSGAIDMYADYSGTVSQEILKSPKPMSLEAMNRGLAAMGLGAAVPLGFNDGYALAMRADVAGKAGIRSISDLARHRDLKFGLSNEFIGRADGWPGLAKTYGLPQRPAGLDHGLAYDAIAGGQVDVIDIYTTDAKITHLGLTVLTDDKGYFPRYDALVLYRLDAATRFPTAWTALRRLEGRIDEQAMIAMNARAELQGVGFDVIARDFLANADTSRPAARGGVATRLFADDLGRLTAQHLWLVAVSVALATLIAVPLAVAAFPHPRARAVLLALTGLLQTIPSLALLAVLIWLLGAIGTVPALIALTAYALLPVMRNTIAGLTEVPDGLRQAATALGMTQAQRLRWIELPIALPTALAGIRIATSIGIGTATIAAFIGAGGFGERIVTGLALNDSQLMLAGAIPAAVLALASEALFETIERWLRRRRGG